MILLNIFFQELSQSYDFKAEERAPIRQVTENMVEHIAQQEHIPLAKEHGLFLLCRRETGEMLNPAATLAENGITSGETLLLL